jgi:WD40 repeat protein
VFDLHGGAISLTAAHGDAFATFSSFDRQLHVFRAGEERPTHSLTTPSEASALSFSPDGASLLVGLHSGAALTYDLKQFKEPRERCAHHTNAVRRFAFLGNSVISGI